MVSAKMFALLSVSSVLTAISLVSVAQTATSSPFANKKPKAWEQQAAPAPTAPARYQVPSYQAPSYQALSYQAQGQTYPVQDAPAATSWPAWQAQYPAPQPQYAPAQQPAPTSQYQAAPQPQYAPALQYQAPATQQQPSYAPAPASSLGLYYPGKPSTQTAPSYDDVYSGAEVQRLPRQHEGQQQAPQYYGHQQQPQQQGYGQQAGGLRGPSKPGWAQRAGFGNVETTLSGHVKAGIAAADLPGRDVKAESIVDIDVRGEISAITDGGLEYGAGLRVRAQRDRYRRGFGGRIGDCAAGDPACSNVDVAGVSRSIKGHTSQFYTSGPESRRETEFALEGAYFFLRSSYGDVVLGRDDGAAYLFSLGAPSLVAVNASNSPVDYTGLDSVKTYNDPSGFSEKIRYTSPRLLGDNIGVGVQVGASYALNAKACGVDYCVGDNLTGVGEPFAPEIENVIEVALALDRTFNNGFSIEATGTYARGSEATGNTAFDDLQAYGAGLELEYGPFVFGTSYLNSNNGVAGQGNYSAYDAGITWKPNNWGFTASYGHADDDVAKLTSDQGVLAVSYDIGKYRLGTGLQYVNRNVPALTPTGRIKINEEAYALFVEAGFTF